VSQIITEGGANLRSVLEATSANEAMATSFQAMYTQLPDYPKVVTAADPRALIYMRVRTIREGCTPS
jgi:hypothetical protein